MTLDEHIKMLEDLRNQIGHGNLQVHYSYNYGDHWKTQVAPEATDVQLGYVVDSSYHQMPKVIEDRDFHQKKEEQEMDSGGPLEVDDEGNTNVYAQGTDQIQQVVLITCF